MHARRQNDGRSLGYVILRALQVRYDQHVKRVASYGATHLGALETILGSLWVTDPIQKLHQVRVCVRVAVTEINGIVVIIKDYFEAQRVGGGRVARYLLDFLRSLEVPDVVATSVPAVPGL